MILKVTSSYLVCMHTVNTVLRNMLDEGCILFLLLTLAFFGD